VFAVKANTLEAASAKLSDEELYAQMRQVLAFLCIEIIVMVFIAERSCLGDVSGNHVFIFVTCSFPRVSLDETTAKTITWALWELAKAPAIQSRLRSEIRATRAGAGAELSLADLDAMPYTLAVVKVCTLTYIAG
jgi:hypothetical protein